MLATTETKTPDHWYGVADRIAAQIGARAGDHDRDGSFVAENYDLLRGAGLIGAAVPVELGGDGLDYATLCGIVRRLGKSCGSTALAFSMHCHQVAVAAWRWRHMQAPTDGLLRRVAAGYAGFWFYTADSLRGRIAQWAEAQRRAGWTVAWQEIAIGGFPFSFDAAFIAPRYGRTGAVSWTWEGERLTAEVPLLVRDRIPLALRCLLVEHPVPLAIGP